MIVDKEQEFKEWVKLLGLVLPEGTEFKDTFIHKCLADNPDMPIQAIIEFLVEFKSLGSSDEDLKYLINFTFNTPLKDMPKYLNDKERWKVSIANWRMKIGT